jgi:hypothetical protein
VKLWAYVGARFASLKAVVHTSDDRGEHGDLFNHGQAYNLMAEQATTDVLLLGDADTTYANPLSLLHAISEVGAGHVPWALPALYRQLTEEVTSALLWPTMSFSEALAATPEYVGGFSWSGLIIVRREDFLSVGGSDERYVGHGADDVALGLKLDTLIGRHWRYDDQAVHLWHPRGQQEKDEHRFSVRQRELTERYMAAAGDTHAMQLISERSTSGTASS